MSFDPDAFLSDAPKGFDPDGFLSDEKPQGQKMAGGESALRGGVDAIPFGEKLSALGTAGALRLVKALSSNPAYQDMDASYAGQLARQREKLAQSERDNPGLTTAGKVGGAVLSSAAMPFKAAQGAGLLPRALATAKNAGAYGVAHGAGTGDTVGESLKNAAVEGATNFVLGGAGHAVASKALPLATKMVGGLGEGLQNLGGKLKVTSLKPTPLVAEAMEALPGGEAAVGREVLKRGIGGLTKKGTLKQLEAAKQAASKEIDDVVSAYDSQGGKPIVLDRAIAAAKGNASELMAEPTTKGTGQRLAELIGEYEARYAGKPVPASEALRLKRVLGDAAYGAGEEAERTGVHAVGEYAKGLARFERAVDQQLDEAVGPAFGEANLAFRRLLNATGAAKRTAARSTGNNLLQNIHTLAGAGLGTSLGGGPGALAGAVAAQMANKYGAQAGARLANAAGGGLKALPRAAAAIGSRVPAGASEALGRGTQVTAQRELLEALGLYTGDPQKDAETLASMQGVR